MNQRSADPIGTTLKYYTGIGSRNTPEPILELMRNIGRKMALMGYTLRSGGATGADTAFADGWGDAWVLDAGIYASDKYKAEIYLPWEGFNDQYSSMEGRYLITNPKAQEIVSEIHPAWNKLSKGAKALHTRNVYQVLGQDLATPSTCVIFYAEPLGTSVKGGTRTAVELAKIHGVPVFNLWYEQVQERMMDFVKI